LPAPTFALSNEELYKDYRIWCEECGHKPKSRQSFLKAVAPLIKQYRKDVECPDNAFRIGGSRTRGYRLVAHDTDAQIETQIAL
jgi:phage/plasmid-associated DNA primase